MKGGIKLPFNTSINEKNKYKFKDISNENYEAYLRFDLNLKNMNLAQSIIGKLKKNKILIQKIIKKKNTFNRLFSLILITKQSKDLKLKRMIKNFKNKKIYKSVKFIRIEKV